MNTLTVEDINSIIESVCANGYRPSLYTNNSNEITLRAAGGDEELTVFTINGNGTLTHNVQVPKPIVSKFDTHLFYLVDVKSLDYGTRISILNYDPKDKKAHVTIGTPCCAYFGEWSFSDFKSAKQFLTDNHRIEINMDDAIARNYRKNKNGILNKIKSIINKFKRSLG